MWQHVANWVVQLRTFCADYRYWRHNVGCVVNINVKRVKTLKIPWGSGKRVTVIFIHAQCQQTRGNDFTFEHVLLTTTHHTYWSNRDYQPKCDKHSEIVVSFLVFSYPDFHFSEKRRVRRQSVSNRKHVVSVSHIFPHRYHPIMYNILLLDVMSSALGQCFDHQLARVLELLLLWHVQRLVDDIQ